MANDLDLINAQIHCEKCFAPLDLGREDNREWIAEKPSVTISRGYRIRPFSTNRLSPAYIVSQLLNYRKENFLRGFYNTVLGEAFTGSNNRLSELEVDACLTGDAAVPTISSDMPVFVGIDMGQVCHITLIAGYGLHDMHFFYWEAIPEHKLIERVQQILETYHVVAGACDRHPYTPLSNAIRDTSEGKILPVEYRGQSVVNLVNDEFGTLSHAQANRTTLLDDVVNAVRRRTLKISGYAAELPFIKKHFRDMVREEKPGEPAVWVKLTGDDHYLHSAGFAVFAIKMKSVIDSKVEVEQRTLIMLDSADTYKNDTNMVQHINTRKSSIYNNDLFA